jgi:hypothetical protein
MRVRLSVIVLLSTWLFPSTIVGQLNSFVGTWRPAHWKPDGRNLGIVLHIVQGQHGLIGTVHFWDPYSDHESTMLNPRLTGRTFSFDVDDDYVKGKIMFWMTVQKDGKTALVKGSGGEMLLDFKLVVRVPDAAQ